MPSNSHQTYQKLRNAQWEAEKHPDSPKAWQGLALAFLESELLPEALSAYGRLRGLAGAEAAIAAVEQACHRYVTTHDAAAALYDVIDLFPEQAGVPERLLAVRLAAKKDWSAAQEHLVRSRQADPEDAETYYWLGEAAFQLGNPREAWTMWDACLQRNPGDERAKKGLAQLNQAPDSLGPSVVVEHALPTVSACLIVKNEARNLETCLASLKGVVDEIVVVDTGSTDDSVAIAERHGAKVGHFEWVDDFSAARNASLDLATSDWVLVIDADEELVVEDAEAFRAGLADSEAKAYRMRIENVGEARPLFAPRCFRRYPGFRFAGRVYEELPILKELRHNPPELPGVRLRHTGHDPVVLAETGKAERNRRLAELALERHPKDPKSWFHLANACWLGGDAMGTLAAIAQIRRLQDYGRHLEPELRQSLALLEARAHEAESTPETAIAILDEALTRFPESVELEEALNRLRPRMQPGTVSACLIVKNEARNLERCLSSLKGHVDEIIVLDTGSTDETVAIAERLGAKVGHFPWIDDFSAARNAGLDLATSEWILVIDADEELVVRDPQGYRDALAAPEAMAYTMEAENLDAEGRVTSRYIFQPRLFRNQRGLRYTGRLHESIHPSLQQIDATPTLLPALLFQHHGYDQSHLAETDKIARNRRLAELMVGENPNDAVAWHHVSTSRWLERDVAGARQALEQVIRLRDAGHVLDAMTYRQHELVAAWIFGATGETARAMVHLEAGLSRFPGFPEYHFERGRLRLAAGQVAGAIADFEACLAGGDWQNLRAGVTGYFAHTELLAIYSSQGDTARAAQHALAASRDPACPPAEAAQLAALAAGLTSAGSAQPAPAPGQPTVSACLIVKNEAQNLDRCLASLKGHVDEIIVVDTGSTDETVAIAERHGAKVGRFAWVDDFAAARNASLDLATSEWILVIDADEELVVEDGERFREFLDLAPSVGGVLPQRNVDAEGRVVSETPALRLWRRHAEVRFVGRVHEAVSASLTALGWELVTVPSAWLRHRGYQPGALIGKGERNVQLAALEVRDRPQDPRAWLNLARSYAMDQRWQEALDTYTQLPGGLAGLEERDWIHAVLSLAEVHLALGRPDAAEALFTESLLRLPGFPEFAFERGRLRYKRGDAAGAIADFETCLAPQARAFPHLVRPDIVDALPHRALDVVRKTHPEAFAPAPAPMGDREALLARLRSNPRDASGFLELALSFYQEETYDKALLAVGQAIELNAGRASAYQLLGLVLSALGQPGWAEKAFATVLQLDPDHPTARESRLACRNLQPEYPLPDDQAAVINRLLSRVQPTVSACLIVKNEARNLETCLASLKGYVDEIVVVDTGSTDETVAIAQRYGAKVSHFTWIDDFAAARNAALSQATSDWVLVIDADEELAIQDPAAWLNVLRNREPGGYVVLVSNLNQAGQSVYGAPILRLFQRLETVHFVNRIHESAAPSLQALGLPFYEALSVELRHWGYREGAIAESGKQERNIRLSEKMVEEKPNDAEAWLNLARSYSFARRYEQSLAAFEQLGRIPGAIEGMVDQVWTLYTYNLAEAYQALGRRQEAEATLSRGVERFPGIPEFRFQRGRIRYELGDVAGAIADFEACLAIQGQPFSAIMREGVTSTLPQEALRQIRERHPEAFAQPEERSEREQVLARLRENPRDASGFLELGLIFYQEEAYDKALLAVGQAIELNAGRAAAYQLLGLVLSALGQPGWAEKAFATVLQLDPDHPTARESRLACRSLQPEYPLPDDQAAIINRLLSRVQPTVSACLIVKNEAKNLDRCLASLKGYVDEIVLVDTGSTDETVAIAERHGAKVSHFTWIDDFSAARNVSLDQATQDWVLVIDADEELVIEDHEAWLNTLRNREPGGYVLTQQNIDEGGHTTYNVPALRLFQRNEAIRYVRNIHESVAPAIRALGWPLYDALDLRLRHTGYQDDVMAGKRERNLAAAEKRVKEHPDDAEGWLNLARSYALAQRSEEALAAFERIAKHEDQLLETTWTMYIYNLAETYGRLGRHREAEATLTRGIERQPEIPEFRFERGQVRYRLGDYRGAIADFESCLRIAGRPFSPIMREGVTDALPREALRQIREKHPEAFGPALPAVSACLIVKNEARHLDRCLASLKSYVNEIVVVDTGSSDETVAIAERHGAKVGHFTWVDDFAAARNASLDLATSDWVLVIDADEELVVEDPAVWAQVVNGPRDRGYILVQRNVDDAGATMNEVLLTRLFPRDERVRFRHRLHEGAEQAITDLGWPLYVLPGVHFRHRGYAPSVMQAQDKGERNIRIARRETEEHPERATAWLNLARSLAFNNHLDEAAAAFEQLRSRPGALAELDNSVWVIYVTTHLGLLLKQQRFDAAERLLTEALERLPDYPRFLYERGRLRYALNRVNEAVADFEACLAQHGRSFAVPVDPAYTDRLPREALRKAAQRTPDRPTVSACLIVKNEARNLERCLSSLKGYVDEIIVVDTGSTDESVAIAQRHGAKIGHFTWVDDFSAARNASLALATSEWILVIDADEELVVENPEAWDAALRHRDTGGYFLENRQVTMGENAASHMLPRLFLRMDALRYENRLHEDVTPAMNRLGLRPVPLPGVHFRHYGYEQANIDAKALRNLQIMIREVESDPTVPASWYNLGRSSLALGQEQPSIDAFAQVARLLEEGGRLPEASFCNFVLLYQNLLAGRGQYDEALHLLNQGLAAVPGYPEFLFERGRLHARLGHRDSARQDFLACMAPPTRAYLGYMRDGIRDVLPQQALAALESSP